MVQYDWYFSELGDKSCAFSAVRIVSPFVVELGQRPRLRCVGCLCFPRESTMPWRRSRRRSFRRHFGVWAGFFVLIAATIWITAQFGGWGPAAPHSASRWASSSSDRHESEIARHSVPEPEVRDSPRFVYPYSIIPGGVRDIPQLREAIASDPVVAVHYAGFNLASARVVHLRAEKTAYAAYRVGDDVFWTKKKIKLARGESLITDGVNYARTRCANRISDQPSTHTSTEEPSPEQLDTPQRLIPPSPRSSARRIIIPPIVPIIVSDSHPRMSAGGGPPNPGIMLVAALALAAYLAYRRKFRA